MQRASFRSLGRVFGVRNFAPGGFSPTSIYARAEIPLPGHVPFSLSSVPLSPISPFPLSPWKRWGLTAPPHIPVKMEVKKCRAVEMFNYGHSGSTVPGTVTGLMRFRRQKAALGGRAHKYLTWVLALTIH